MIVSPMRFARATLVQDANGARLVFDTPRGLVARDSMHPTPLKRRYRGHLHYRQRQPARMVLNVE
jgi:hypothetical protein